MMNKMTKGALSIGVGAALLLGGGGTLAVWNAEATVAPGTIAAGDLNITAGAGTWTNAAGKTIDINNYKVVPGDVLTFTQALDMTLVGDQMKAKLEFVTDSPKNGFTNSQEPQVGLFQGVDAAGKPLPLNPTSLTAANDGEVLAKAVFTFNSQTGARVDANATLGLGTTKFTLTQVVK